MTSCTRFFASIILLFKGIADSLKLANKSYFKYEVWDTDHPFTNKRVSLMNELIPFLNK